MSQYAKLFILSIFAGISISFGAMFYLIIPNQYFASAIFSLGIILVMTFNFKLFTGVIPKQFQLNQSLLTNIIIYFGNIFGAMISSFFALSSSKSSIIISKAFTIIENKTDFLRTAIAGIACGIIIGLIVHIQHQKFRCIMAIPLIMLFILLGFEHCIANSFYMLASSNIKLDILLSSTIGNIIGGLFVSIGIECYD